MRFPLKFVEPLVEGRFLKRYKRFFADIEIDGQVVVAHVPNTGSLKSCLEPGCPARVSKSSNPARKLAYTLEFLKPGDSWVGVNTQRSNDLVWEVWQTQSHTRWLDFDDGIREVKINSDTRLDLRLSSHAEKELHHFVEVKNVTMKGEGPQAQFPDAVTSRGQKHLTEMIKLVRDGHTAEIVFTVQRDDCTEFSPADHIDPEYGRLLRKAVDEGVVVSAWPCVISDDGVMLTAKKPLKVVL